MPLDSKLAQCISTLFLQQPCWMIEPLAKELRYSIPSIRRFLAEVGYYSSFTHNGRWYTLRSIPRFDGDGLWFHRDVGFSRTGSLTRTLVELTTRSAAGLSAEQLGAKLQCRCHSVLVKLCRQGRLHRQKIGHSHLYFAIDPAIAAAQHQTVEGLQTQLPAEIEVLILVEFIRNPDAAFEQLAKAISRKRGVTIGVAQIERIFERHGLKKTIRTVQPKP